MVFLRRYYLGSPSTFHSECLNLEATNPPPQTLGLARAARLSPPTAEAEAGAATIRLEAQLDLGTGSEKGY